MSTGLLSQPVDRRVLVAGGLLYAAGASLTAPLTSAATAAVLAPCAVVLVLSLRRPVSPERRHVEGRLSRTVLAWGSVVALTAIWDLAAWLRQPAPDIASPEHPTASLLLDPLTGSTVPRFLLWCLWLYLGYRLVRR